MTQRWYYLSSIIATLFILFFFWYTSYFVWFSWKCRCCANVDSIFRRIFFDLLQVMNEDWREYTSSRCGARIMKSSADLAHRASRWIVGLQIGSVTFYSLGVLAANMNDPERIEPYARELILKMALPFNISTETIYVTVQSVQFYHLFLVGLGITIVNSLLVTLVSPKCAMCPFIIRFFKYWSRTNLIFLACFTLNKTTLINSKKFIL